MMDERSTKRRVGGANSLIAILRRQPKFVLVMIGYAVGTAVAICIMELARLF